MLAETQNEAVREWWLVEPPNVHHHVVGVAQLDALVRGKKLDVGNFHQLCGETPGPRGKPLTSVEPGWMLLENIKWIKMEHDTEYVPGVVAALGNFIHECRRRQTR